MNWDGILHTDGASRGNPGPAGAGWIIYAPDGSELDRGAEPLPPTTNNAAEYQALLLGLKAAQRLQLQRLLVRMDSELIVKQLNGAYRVTNAGLQPLYAQVKQAARAFAAIAFEHVPREQNREADRLASAAAQGKVPPARHIEAERADAEETAAYRLPLRVRYGETDQMGIVYYANYFDWFTEARTETMRRWGVAYRQWEEDGIFLPVLEAHCEYRKPARYDDRLLIATRVTRLTPLRLAFAYEVLKVNETDDEEIGDAAATASATSAETLAVGWTEHAFVDAQQRPLNLRKRHPQLWEHLVNAVPVDDAGRAGRADDDRNDGRRGDDA